MVLFAKMVSPKFHGLSCPFIPPTREQPFEINPTCSDGLVDKLTGKLLIFHVSILPADFPLNQSTEFSDHLRPDVRQLPWAIALALAPWRCELRWFTGNFLGDIINRDLRKIKIVGIGMSQNVWDIMTILRRWADDTGKIHGGDHEDVCCCNGDILWYNDGMEET